MPYKSKEKAREYQRNYRETNRLKINAKRKEYRENNKAKIREDARKYYQKNREKTLEYNRKYREDNLEKLNEARRLYRKTDNGYKSRTIGRWKCNGLVDDYDKVYERFEYTLFCDLCRCDLDYCTKSRKCMDHDHETGLFRNILCHVCNIKRR